MTLIKNIRFSVNDEKADGYVLCDNGKIIDAGRGNDVSSGVVMDGLGHILYSGLCDIHTHGARGVDFTLSSTEDICKLSNWYASCGVTSIFATTTTQTRGAILEAVKNIARASMQITGTHIDGIHLEGPFLSHSRRGAHNENLLLPPDISLVKEAKALCCGLKLRITIAPELQGAYEFIEQCVKIGVGVTLGHSAASSECAVKAFNCGANCITHTFNGMNQLHHREPGLLGAGLSEEVYAELICDGLHVHPQAVKLFSRAKGQNKAVLISDSIILAGCSEADGVMESAGEKVQVVDGKILTLNTGTLAGSSLKLCDGVKNYSDFACVSLDEAAKSASGNAAKAVGIFDVCGSIEVGKRADFVLMSSEGKLVHTICNEKIVF